MKFTVSSGFFLAVTLPIGVIVEAGGGINTWGACTHDWTNCKGSGVCIGNSNYAQCKPPGQASGTVYTGPLPGIQLWGVCTNEPFGCAADCKCVGNSDYAQCVAISDKRESFTGTLPGIQAFGDCTAEPMGCAADCKCIGDANHAQCKSLSSTGWVWAGSNGGCCSQDYVNCAGSCTGTAGDDYCSSCGNDDLIFLPNSEAKVLSKAIPRWQSCLNDAGSCPDGLVCKGDEWYASCVKPSENTDKQIWTGFSAHCCSQDGLICADWCRTNPSEQTCRDCELVFLPNSEPIDATKEIGTWKMCLKNPTGCAAPLKCLGNEWYAACNFPWVSGDVWEGGAAVVANGAVANEACTATGWGDPHMVTFDGLKYDAHAFGHIVMIRSLTTEFEIQARTQKIDVTWGKPAVTTGVAIRPAEAANMPIVQVVMSDASSAIDTLHYCPVKLFVGGVERTLDQGLGIDGATFMTTGRHIVMEFPSEALRIDMTVEHFGRCHFDVDYHLLDCKEGDSIVGLLGTPNGNAGDDWMTPQGTTIPLPEGNVGKFFFQPAYEYVTQNWCVPTASEAIFVYEDGKDFDYYDHCSDDYDPALEEIITEAPPDVANLCGDDLGCLIDGTNLGEPAALEFLDNPAHERVEVLSVPCDMTTGTTANPNCPNQPVIEFQPSYPGEPAPAGLLYDFTFDATGKRFTFKVSPEAGQTDEDNTDIYVTFQEPLTDVAGDIACKPFEPECNSDDNDSTVKSITALCRESKTHSVTAVTVSYVLRGAADSGSLSFGGSINECCNADEGTDPVYQFTYVVHCTCPSSVDVARKLRGVK